ncbi:hypothetical protein MKW94_021214, partial [Papaver nudicaule]|nr:hypothetical protein [Papaver nudicaule]
VAEITYMLGDAFTTGGAGMKDLSDETSHGTMLQKKKKKKKTSHGTTFQKKKKKRKTSHGTSSK